MIHWFPRYTTFSICDGFTSVMFFFTYWNTFLRHLKPNNLRNIYFLLFLWDFWVQTILNKWISTCVLNKLFNWINHRYWNSVTKHTQLHHAVLKFWTNIHEDYSALSLRISHWKKYRLLNRSISRMWRLQFRITHQLINIKN